MDFAFPFRFPMAILLVDDDMDVIDSLARSFAYLLPEHKVYKMHSPKSAINFLSDHALKFTSTPSEIDFSSYAPRGEVVFNTDSLSNLEALKEHAERVGIVVMDYAMPEMSGIEFAKQIAKHSLPKILLTGQATEHEALSAFNSGLIERYISKDESKALPTLVTYIREVQKKWFNAINSQFFDWLGESHFSFLTHADVQIALNDLCSSLNVEITAPHFDPPGLLVASGTDERFLIYVADAGTMEWKIDIARNEDVEPVLIDAMQSRSGIYLPEVANVGDASGLEHQYLYKLSPLTAATHYALLRMPKK
jgi:CheY-like chemotaxis protein